MFEEEKPKENYEEKPIEINAGHTGGFKQAKLDDGTDYICKKDTSIVEAIAYLELAYIDEQVIQEHIFPDLYNFKVFDINKKEIFNFLDARKEGKDISEILEILREKHLDFGNELSVDLDLELLSDEKTLDVKVGPTYSDKEVAYNLKRISSESDALATKNMLNKSQMLTSSMLAYIGGAADFQIANSANVFFRQIYYPFSKSTLEDYLNQFELDDLYKIQKKLHIIASFIKDKSLCSVGTSLFYYGNQVCLIDLAHYMSSIGMTALPKEQYDYTLIHDSLFDALLTQISFIDNAIIEKHKKVEPSPTPIIFNTPEYQKTLEDLKNDPNQTIK